MATLCSGKYIKLGRGAHNQHNPFHQEFLDEKDRLQKHYVHLKTHREKRRIQEALIDWVHRKNGKFVEECEKDEKGTIRVVTDHKRLLEKVAQALREPRKQKYKTVSLYPASQPTMIPYLPSAKTSYSLQNDIASFFAANQPFDESSTFHWSQDSEAEPFIEYSTLDSALDHPLDRVPLMACIDDEFIDNCKESDPFWIPSPESAKDDVLSEMYGTKTLDDDFDLEYLFLTEFWS